MPLSSAFGVYLISPVFSSIVAPAGAPSPRANFVPSGAVAGFPSLSVKVGVTATSVSTSPVFSS